ncbi:hypothetical protein LCGC14_0969810 [marine sediment metagenome]|uniref:Uncharacterized protein n=1 Tax=marine sediment metagenome TaxID=412755 RepID=A0A0F9NY34_9ZZZZ
MKNKIIIVGGDALYERLFKQIGSVTKNINGLIAAPEKISLVLFTGGEDIHPYFYNGEDPRRICMTSFSRDLYEKKIFDYCKIYKVKMTGICRGFQFLNVMAGGFMYQHIDNHGIAGEHSVYMDHIDASMDVTSTHHQLVGLKENAHSMAWSEPRRATKYIGPYGKLEKTAPEKEVEAAIFPKINAMGVQYHPEFMKSNALARLHYLTMVKDFIKMNIHDFVQRYSGRESHGRHRSRSV